MKGWKEYKLGEAPLQIIDGDRGKNYPSNNDFKKSEYCLFLSTKNVREDGFDFSDCVFITKEKDEQLRKGKLNRLDLVLTTRGTVGNLGFYNKSVKFNNIRINSGMVIIRPDVQKLIPEFNYYLFKKLQDNFHTYTSGSAQPQLPIKDLVEMEILLPPLPEQRAIASVLSSLDDKIDLLNRQNKTLEGMAEALFRQWFVEEADEGWEVGKVSDLCSKITKGTTPTTFGQQFTETGINFIKAESINDSGDFILEKIAKISNETHQLLNRSIIENRDVLCSIAGTIGRIAIVMEDLLPANTNQAVAILRINNDICFPEFMYLFLKSSQFREKMDSKIVHAVQPNLSLGEIGNTTIQIPPIKKMSVFKQIATSIFEKKYYNVTQIRNLEKLRNTLLPKMMSGEVKTSYSEENI
ncbi:MAG: restriction endonuclease subunit S [Spirochaetales bacterium]|nr:restriction endonuclease subunit S [Spirochaetales bacterium]